MAGSALARMVWSSAARNIATTTPGNTRRNAARSAAASGCADQPSARVGSGSAASRKDRLDAIHDGVHAREQRLVGRRLGEVRAGAAHQLVRIIRSACAQQREIAIAR